MGPFCTLTLALWSRSPYLPTLSNLGSSAHLSRLKFRFLCFIEFKADDGFSNHKTHKTNRKMKYEYLLLRHYCCLRNHQNFFPIFGLLFLYLGGLQFSYILIPDLRSVLRVFDTYEVYVNIYQDNEIYRKCECNFHLP